jgi:hypothetical protein
MILNSSLAAQLAAAAIADAGVTALQALGAIALAGTRPLR